MAIIGPPRRRIIGNLLNALSLAPLQVSGAGKLIMAIKWTMGTDINFASLSLSR